MMLTSIIQLLLLQLLKHGLPNADAGKGKKGSLRIVANETDRPIVGEIEMLCGWSSDPVDYSIECNEAYWDAAQADNRDVAGTEVETETGNKYWLVEVEEDQPDDKQEYERHKVVEDQPDIIQYDEISGGNSAKPHEYPWIVRIASGCAANSAADGLCGGTLISPRLILTAYHCTYHPIKDNGDKPCDHSDGKRLAVLGRHEINFDDLTTYTTIPIIDVKYPENQGLKNDFKSHDFAMLVLKEPAKFSDFIKPICLPQQDEDFGGETAIAAGWGRHSHENTTQSPVLKRVNLSVSTKKYKHTKMFGTELRKNLGKFQDPCSGDSGGPLMYFNRNISAYTIIGTVNGAGYDCNSDQYSEYEGSKNGVWNKVSAWVDWIKKEMDEMGEKGCKEQN